MNDVESETINDDLGLEIVNESETINDLGSVNDNDEGSETINDEGPKSESDVASFLHLASLSRT